MKIDLNAQILDLDGDPILESQHADAKIATLRSVLIRALVTEIPNEKLDAVTKISRYTQAQRIHGHKGAGSPEFKAEELAEFKTLISPRFTIIVTGRVDELLETPWKAVKAVSDGQAS